MNVPTIDRSKYAPAKGALRGAYILADCKGKPDLILIGTGSEVQLCLGAYERLTNEGVKVRVVSMPSWELFEMQSAQYQEKVLPDSVRARVSVEAGSTLGWEKYVGLHDKGTAIGVDTFGESAPMADLWPEFGFTVNNVAAKARQTLKKNRKK